MLFLLDYWTTDPVEKIENEYDEAKPETKTGAKSPTDGKFVIKKAGDCTNATQYGYAKAQPCVLVKMNKVTSHLFEDLLRRQI